jgi:hypothetical protein
MKPSVGYRRLLVASGIVLAWGCGLSEYQAKYEKQQERMNYLDQENLYLSKDPIEKKDSNNAAVKLYVRLPLGISTIAEEKLLGILNRYHNNFAKAPKESDAKYSEIEGVYLVAEINKDWNDFLRKSMEPFKNIDPLKAGRVELAVPGQQAREFRTLSFTDATDPVWSYQFYFYREKENCVALGFRGSEKAMNSETAKKAMEFSVKSLAVGKAAEPLVRKSTSD